MKFKVGRMQKLGTMETKTESDTMIMFNSELEMIELRNKLFDSLFSEYNDLYAGKKRNNGEINYSQLLNRDEFLFGCKKGIIGTYQHSYGLIIWFFYFVDKIVILSKELSSDYQWVSEYFKVYEYGSKLKYISIYDVSKIVFQNHKDSSEDCLLPRGVNTFNFEMKDFDVDVDNLVYENYGNRKWFDLKRFEFKVLGSELNRSHDECMYNIMVTIRSNIANMIEKNELNKMQKQFQEKIDLLTFQLELQSETNRKQMERQEQKILEQESQITMATEVQQSRMELMQNQIETQYKLIISLQVQNELQEAKNREQFITFQTQFEGNKETIRKQELLLQKHSLIITFSLICNVFLVFCSSYFFLNM